MSREAEYEARFPELPWREPVKVFVNFGCSDASLHLLGCRFCIAMYGLRSMGCTDVHWQNPERLSHVVKLPQTRKEFDRHMREVHAPC